jgi:hypothetical protein
VERVDNCHNVAYMVVSLKLTRCSLILDTIRPWDCPDLKGAAARSAETRQRSTVAWSRYSRLNQSGQKSLGASIVLSPLWSSHPCLAFHPHLLG